MNLLMSRGAVPAESKRVVRATTAEEILSATVLFERHARFVATFACRLGVPRDDVDDVVQETFMVVHRRGGFRPGAAQPTTWLASITLKVWSTIRRTRRRRPEAPELVEERNGRDEWPRLEARYALVRVEAALLKLDEASRAVFVLFELQGQTCEDISQGLEIPVGTVYSRLHKARQVFQRAYGSLSEPGRMVKRESR